MLCAFSKIRRSRVAAILLAMVGGLVLVTVYSVRPAASRFDSLTHRLGWVGVVSQPAPGAPTGKLLRVEPFSDYSLVFPEQPSIAIP